MELRESPRHVCYVLKIPTKKNMTVLSVSLAPYVDKVTKLYGTAREIKIQSVAKAARENTTDRRRLTRVCLVLDAVLMVAIK